MPSRRTPLSPSILDLPPVFTHQDGGEGEEKGEEDEWKAEGSCCGRTGTGAGAEGAVEAARHHDYYEFNR